MRCNICFQKIFHKRGLNLALCSSCIKDIEPVLYSKNIVVKIGLSYSCCVLFRYDKTIKRIINLFKSSREIKQSKTFTGLILENLNLTTYPDLIVPVPSHPLDEIKRGFSHMNYIASLLSRELDTPFYPILGRKIFPLFKYSQKIKNKRQRRQTKEKFYVRVSNVEIRDKNILLIDDIMTTGLTMNECAKVLLENGAAKVQGVSLGVTPS